MAFGLEFSVDAERDFGLIFDHLGRSYLDFGESLESALGRAEARIREIRTAARRILTAPHRGERHDDLLPGLRHLAIDGQSIGLTSTTSGRRFVCSRCSSVGRIISVTCWSASSRGEEG